MVILKNGYRYLKREGLLYVVSAPSGTGKTTLCRRIVDSFFDLTLSISYTTRPPRNGEKDSRDYHFVTDEEFQKMIAEERFAEWAEIYGHRYGTSVNSLEKCWNKGIDIIFDIDEQGARQIKKRYTSGVFIYLLPPSLKELEKRLVDRGTDSREVIKKRLKEVKKEISHSTWYNYAVVNDRLEDAFLKLKSIIIAERCRRSRLFSYPGEL